MRNLLQYSPANMCRG
ncbi:MULTISPECIES: IncL/M-type plasmid replication leader peptide RepB, partial [Enterobacterales]